MPKSLFQEIIFTLIMVFFMVYGMICYNIVLATGEMTNQVFLMAFNELKIMGPVAFVLELLVVGPLTKKIVFKLFDPSTSHPFLLTEGISICTIWFMCPLMSLVATILFKGGFNSNFVCNWIVTMVKNYPMAAFYQLLFAGPVVRKIFGLIFRDKGNKETAEK